MKRALLLLLLTIALFSNSQKTYVPDDHISIDGYASKQKIVDYVNRRVLCEKVPADEIVSGTLHGLMGFRKGSKYGLMNIYGKIIVPATFDAYDEGEGTYPIELQGDYFAVRKGETKGLIDSTGKFVVPPGNYDRVWDAKAGFGAAERNGLFGLFKNGKMVLPLEYDSYYAYDGDPFEFKTESQLIRKDYLCGLIDTKGVIVQPVIYEKITQMGRNCWLMRGKDDRDYAADSTGKSIGGRSFISIFDIIPNYIFAAEDNLYMGIVRFDGTVISPFEYSIIGRTVSADAVFVLKNHKWGIFHLNNPKQPVSFDFDSKYTPVWQEDIAAVQVKGLWGIVNTEGKLLCDAVFENESHPVFQNGYAVVARNGKTGILRNDGTLILPCEYESVDPYLYHNQMVRKQGKVGILSQKFEILVPCEFDEVDIFHDDYYLVRSGEKTGIYQVKKGLIVPVEFDEITLFNDNFRNIDYFQTSVNQKIGFVNQSGKTVLPNNVEKVLSNDSLGVLVSANGQLKKISLETGEELPLLPDSVKKFETTSFIYINSRWYCVTNTDQKIIGKEYISLGQFNDAGRAVAYPSDSDYPIAINSKEEALKPGFHLVNNILIDTILERNDPALISSIVIQKQLIEDDLVVRLIPFELFDNLGYETGITQYGLYCFYKKNYFDQVHPFPVEPLYEFNFSDHYSNWGPMNSEGWRWADLKSNYSEDRLSYLSKNTVLVHESGKEIRKENYIPINSTPFFEHTFNQQYETGASAPIIEMPESLPWDSLGKFPDVIDSLKNYFPTAKGLTTHQFILQYKDSVYTHEFASWTYVPEFEEIQTFHYSFYKTYGAQLFNLPPPSKVKYRFVLAEPKKIKGGENLRDFRKEAELLTESGIYTPLVDIPFIQAIPFGEKTAFVFGDLGYFVYPKFDQYVTEVRKGEIIQAYLKNPEYRIVAADIRTIKKYDRFVESGFAIPADIQYVNDSLRFFLADHNNLQLYQYPKNLGLALENQLLLEPQYRSITTDNPAISRGNSTFMVIDSLEQVWRYDLYSRKLIADEQISVIATTKGGIITQNTKNKLYGFNNFGVQLYNSFEDFTQGKNLIPNVNDIQQLEFTGDCNYNPLTTMYGEDSIIYHEDGTYEFAYHQYCDTNVMGKYGKFKPGLELHAYKRVDEQEKLVFPNPDEPYIFSKTAVANGFPFNHHGDGDYVIEETDEGLRLILGERTLDIPEKEYLQIRKTPMGSNGFGGVYRKKKYIPYQTLLPFPEKHAVNIHLKKSYYLVGESGKLELVRLNNDQTLVKSGLTFTSGQEMEEKYYADTEVMYKIQDFMGLDSW